MKFQEFCTTHWPDLFTEPFDGRRDQVAGAFSSFLDAGWRACIPVERGEGATVMLSAAVLYRVAQYVALNDASPIAVVSRHREAAAIFGGLLERMAKPLHPHARRLLNDEVFIGPCSVALFSHRDWLAYRTASFGDVFVDDWNRKADVPKTRRAGIVILKDE